MEPSSFWVNFETSYFNSSLRNVLMESLVKMRMKNLLKRKGSLSELQGLLFTPTAQTIKVPPLRLILIEDWK